MADLRDLRHALLATPLMMLAVPQISFAQFDDYESEQVEMVAEMYCADAKTRWGTDGTNLYKDKKKVEESKTDPIQVIKKKDGDLLFFYSYKYRAETMSGSAIDRFIDFKRKQVKQTGRSGAMQIDHTMDCI